MAIMALLDRTKEQQTRWRYRDFSLITSLFRSIFDHVFQRVSYYVIIMRKTDVQMFELSVE